MKANSTDPKELFGSTSIPKLFFTAALPGAVGMLVSSIYSTMDGILVGNYVGDVQFAAINLAMPFVIILFAFGDLIGVGSAVPISIALGEGRDDDANNLFTCSCLMNIACGGVIGLVLWLLAPLIFELMGASSELAGYATTYLRVYAAFAPLTTVGYALDNYLRISGKIRRSFFANTFMAVFGAVLEFVLLGPLNMGVGAAALAFSLSMVSAVLIAGWPFVRGGLQLRFVRPRFSWADTVEIFRCGFSTFLDNIAGRVTSIVLNAMILAMGGADAVAIYGLTMFALGFAIPLYYGTLDALQPAVGYNWGARAFDRVKWLEIWCFGAVAVISLLLMVAILAWPQLLTHLFMPDAQGWLLSEATVALRLFALSLIIRWFGYAVHCFLVNVGEYVPATIMTICSALAFPLLLAVLLAPMGLTGIWLIEAANALLTSLLGTVFLLRLRHKIHGMVASEGVT